MKADISGNTIANQVRMERSQHNGAFLLLEGGTDTRVFGNLVDQQQCRLIDARGKENVLDALTILEGAGVPGILAVVDADHWRLENVSPVSPNVVMTDTHDIETMMLISPALEKVLGVYGSANKISGFVNQTNTQIRNTLLSKAAPLGYLRWISARDGHNLRFEDLRYHRFIDVKTLHVDVEHLIQTVKQHSQRLDIDSGHLSETIELSVGEGHDLWQVCSGHDMVEILSLSLRRVWGSHSRSEVSSDTVRKSLWLAYEYEYFTKSQLFHTILGWEIKNKPYSILKGAS